MNAPKSKSIEQLHPSDAHLRRDSLDMAKEILQSGVGTTITAEQVINEAALLAAYISHGTIPSSDDPARPGTGG